MVKPGDDIKTIPRLIIDKYNFEPSLVKAGELTGAIVFTYEDSTGEIVEHRQEFTLKVMEGI